MAKLTFSSFGALFLGCIVIAACVGDDPAATPGTTAEGGLDGPCFTNGTCNDGLSCEVVQGAARCAHSAADASAGTDASSVGNDATTSDPGDSGASSCTLNPTKFPCGAPNPPFACYGATQSCTVTGCNPGELSWQCFSTRHCGNVAACCLSADSATLNAGANCAQGSLQISATPTTGSLCSTTSMCKAGDIRLCNASSDCPVGQKCSPVKATGGGAAFDGKVFLSACVP